MKLRMYRGLWGVLTETDGERASSPFLDFEEALKEISRLGYDGIEVPFKFTLLVGGDRFSELLEKYNLRVIFQVFTDGPVVPGSGIVFGGPYPGFTPPSQPGESDKKQLVQNHLRVFKEQVEGAQKFNPTLVNSHSLKDYFTEEMATEFFTEALAWQKEKGYRVLHETHRKRYLHSPWVARGFIPNFPELKLVADLSHWINIAETNTMDPDLTRVIEKFAERFEHTHCRVGYDHGPQVPDPRAECWLEYMEGHERWWDKIWLSLSEAGVQEVTMTPEHGPPNYQICDPKTGTPLADIWDVNHWVALRSYALAADTEEAPYEVLKAHEGWEERSVPGLKWISGDGFDIRPHDGESADKIFYKLFHYIDGGNDQGVKIPMTSPVSYRVIPGEGPNCEGNFTMSFFIPMAFQENTPLPLDSDVYIEERPAMNVAALKFPGFPGDVDFGIKAAELFELASSEGVNAAVAPLWEASYDGPNVIINSMAMNRFQSHTEKGIPIS